MQKLLPCSYYCEYKQKSSNGGNLEVIMHVVITSGSNKCSNDSDSNIISLWYNTKLIQYLYT